MQLKPPGHGRAGAQGAGTQLPAMHCMPTRQRGVQSLGPASLPDPEEQAVLTERTASATSS
jgi:hypothetical protein